MYFFNLSSRDDGERRRVSNGEMLQLYPAASLWRTKEAKRLKFYLPDYQVGNGCDREE